MSHDTPAHNTPGDPDEITSRVVARINTLLGEMDPDERDAIAWMLDMHWPPLTAMRLGADDRPLHIEVTVLTDDGPLTLMHLDSASCGLDVDDNGQIIVTSAP